MHSRHNAKYDIDVDEGALAQNRMGTNQLQGEDQLVVRNQRQAVSDVKPDADDIIDSFEKLDKDTRARKDLSKGVRSGDGTKGDNDGA